MRKDLIAHVGEEALGVGRGRLEAPGVDVEKPLVEELERGAGQAVQQAPVEGPAGALESGPCS